MSEQFPGRPHEVASQPFHLGSGKGDILLY
jgi:hypothetical protein